MRISTIMTRSTRARPRTSSTCRRSSSKGCVSIPLFRLVYREWSRPEEILWTGTIYRPESVSHERRIRSSFGSHISRAYRPSSRPTRLPPVYRRRTFGTPTSSCRNAGSERTRSIFWRPVSPSRPAAERAWDEGKSFCSAIHHRMKTPQKAREREKQPWPRPSCANPLQRRDQTSQITARQQLTHWGIVSGGWNSASSSSSCCSPMTSGF